MSRKVNHLVVHCSATPADRDIGAVEIRRWHREKGWRDIGYHFVIKRSGVVQRGRQLNTDAMLDPNEVGAHVAGQNAASVGICLVGGCKRVGGKLVTETNFLPAQYAALRTLLASLRAQFPGAVAIGHRDLAKGKDCPTFDVAAWVAQGEPDHAPAPPPKPVKAPAATETKENDDGA